jgi:hypothetical protein
MAFAVNISKWKKLEFLHNCDDIDYLFEKPLYILFYTVCFNYDKLIFCNQ